MSATVILAERNGPSATSVETLNPANLNMGSADATGLSPVTYPITAQAGGASFEKWVRVYVQALGGSNQVDNLEVWLSSLGGGYLTGEGMVCNLATSGYAAATYPGPGPSGVTSLIALNAMPTSGPGGPNLGIGGLLSGAIVVAPAYSDYMVLQAKVTEATPAGNANTKTLTVQWDEM
jgi:hypothetical protein